MSYVLRGIGIVLLLGGLFAHSPASAAQVQWDLCEANHGEYRVYYTIDNNSLQVESFTTVNNSAQAGYMYIKEDGIVIFDMLVSSYVTNTQSINGFKFRRIPATDHDDPNSVRYPQGVVMGCRWPAY